MDLLGYTCYHKIDWYDVITLKNTIICQLNLDGVDPIQSRSHGWEFNNSHGADTFSLSHYNQVGK